MRLRQERLEFPDRPMLIAPWWPEAWYNLGWASGEILSKASEKPLHFVVIAQEFEVQGVAAIFKHQPLVQAEANLVMPVAQLPQSRPRVLMRPAERCLHGGDQLTQLLSPSFRQGPEPRQQPAVELDVFQSSLAGSNRPLNVTIRPACLSPAWRACSRFWKARHSRAVRPYSRIT